MVDTGNRPVRKYREKQGEVEVRDRGKKRRTSRECVRGKGTRGNRGIDITTDGCDIHCEREMVGKGQKCSAYFHATYYDEYISAEEPGY